ncbi:MULTISPECIES: hypothetical protein [Azorhizobium]|nr:MULTISPECIES: hypothetical protein [Azorhizobium]TDT96672.1 hypothetical protein DFO45_1868 [Azorhizobium sp. AG788]
MTESVPPAQPSPPAPLCRYRLSVGASLGAYPLITGILYGLGPLTETWEVWQKTLAIVPVMVPCMVFGVIPGVQRIGGRWVRRASRN